MDYDNDFEEGYAKTSLGNLYYRHHKGNAPCIVFLHGLGASSRVWKKLVEFLPDNMDVYLVDLLGHGKSDKPHIAYNIDVQVQAIHEFLESLWILDCYLFGHSYGGWIAAKYASEYDGLHGIMLEDAAGIKEYFVDIIDRGEEASYKANMLKVLLEINGNDKYVMESIMNADADTSGWLDEAALSKIRCKCIVIWGSNDKVVDIHYSDILISSIKGSAFRMVDGAGHEPHYTNPEEVASIIADFTG
ncbi:MAG: alpha/beta fold hydrolase [Candidatus Micrarchaeia archaeon]